MNEQQEVLEIMKNTGEFQIEPMDSKLDFDRGFIKLDLNQEQKKHISALLQYIPTMMAIGTISNTYVAKFPNGLPHVLTNLKQGGFGTMVQKDGRFVGSASLYSTAGQTAVLGVFTAMSIASGQYFLTQINNELKMMRLNIDKILEFLYGDKKAELMSEVSFVKYAYQNYSSIMSHGEQRIATIGSLQNAKKVAMKDVEFYMSDLDSTVNGKDIVSLVEKSFQIKESLELSMQLYGMSSVLETYYAQNHDTSYNIYIENEMISYIDKCEKRILSSFSILSGRVRDYKGKLWEKIDKSDYEKSIGELVDSMNSGEESTLRKSLRSVLRATSQVTEYYLNKDGNVYLKVS
ncbi:MAG: hypothetical protein KH921_07180 [Erysipelotrichaceae bacterium]|nr:hypothetical protein [Erysipelotrichaceae bacterium]